MRVPSKKSLIPRKAVRVISVGQLFLGTFVVLCILVFLFSPDVFIFLPVVFAIIFGSLYERRRIQKLAQSRQTDSICTFARSFDYRNIDIRIIRAVYEELQFYYSDVNVSLPVRATDSFEKDLKLDSEDLGDLGRDIAFRAQRSMSGAEMNPFYGKVKTVNDLVLFLAYQPATSVS